MISWVIALGRVLGLGGMAGVRPSLTLAVIGVVSALGIGPGVNGPFGFLEHWLAIVAFVLLALFESGFDKVPRWERLQARLTLPYRMVAGAVAGAAMFPGGWPGMSAGAAVGAGIAWLSQHNKGLTRPRVPSAEAVAVTFRSLWEDLYTFLGAILVLVFWPVGYAVGGLEVAVYVLARRRRRSKYRELQRRGRPA